MVVLLKGEFYRIHDNPGWTKKTVDIVGSSKKLAQLLKSNVATDSFLVLDGEPVFIMRILRNGVLNCTLEVNGRQICSSPSGTDLMFNYFMDESSARKLNALLVSELGVGLPNAN